MKRRVLCWNEENIEKNNGVSVIAHTPVKRNLALICDDEWEGAHNGYASVVKIGEKYRIYYRADNFRQYIDGQKSPGVHGVICVAESRDGGITFRKPNIGKYEYNGTKNNNIIFDRTEKPIDNFAVFYDKNPACPKEERFKALCEINYGGGDPRGTQLHYYASEDGLDFKMMYALPVRGTFDSYNVMVWDEDTEQYFLYYRAFHTPEGEDRLSWKGARPNWLRHVRVATSKDFREWTEHGRISFEEGQEVYQLYTNQITKYPRANIFIGFPVRYYDRMEEKRNFHFMPLGDRHEALAAKSDRGGTAVTDCVIMTSKDGFTFNRRDEAFLTPGVENRNNWWYGNCYMAYGLIETEAEEDSAPNEISFYMGENYRIKGVNFRRFTIRLDGFFSWRAPFRGGEVLTKPITLDGGEMQLNFATSALGGVIVSVCDENGDALEGYRSYTMFGDSVDRPVEFEKPLSALKGKTVRLKFEMKDAHLYSFAFV